MALDNAETLSDPGPLGDTLERAPDSAPLSVSLNTKFESGIPPARLRAESEAITASEPELTLDNGVARMELALVGVTRTEANLGLLIRGLKHLSAGALAAREANTELMHELDELRTQLARNYDEEQAMRFRMGQLEQLLDVIRHESSRERSFLLEQQDLFLVQILTDHERQVGELRRQLQEVATHKADALELAELTAQRDQAREYATRCERERDAAWHELSSGHAPSPSSVPAVTLRRHVTPSPLPAEALNPAAAQTSQRKSGALAIGSISLRAASAPAMPAPDTERSSSRSASGTGYSLSGEDLGE